MKVRILGILLTVITLLGLSIPMATPVLACDGVDGRMTGGGTIDTKATIPAGAEVRVTHGLEIHCDVSDLPNNLEVDWGGNKFHMTELLTNACTLVAPPDPPTAPFNTMVGTGTGRLNNLYGYTVNFTLTDEGEPGVADSASIEVKDPGGTTVLLVSGHLKNGNQQAHKDNK